eukprot:765061-Hanusia_phi.AAC.1
MEARMRGVKRFEGQKLSAETRNRRAVREEEENKKAERESAIEGGEEGGKGRDGRGRWWGSKVVGKWGSNIISLSTRWVTKKSRREGREGEIEEERRTDHTKEESTGLMKKRTDDDKQGQTEPNISCVTVEFKLLRQGIRKPCCASLHCEKVLDLRFMSTDAVQIAVGFHIPVVREVYELQVLRTAHRYAWYLVALVGGALAHPAHARQVECPRTAEFFLLLDTGKVQEPCSLTVTLQWQVLLNAMSLGCAGFNTALGPLRPHLVASTVIAQSFSWYINFPVPHQRFTTLVASLISFFVTMSPEILYLGARMTRSSSKHDKAAKQKQRNGSGALVVVHFKPKAMGCISCANTVRGVFDGVEGIVTDDVSVEKATATLYVKDKYESVKLVTEAVEKVTAAGFPTEIISFEDDTALPEKTKEEAERSSGNQ